MKKWVFLGIILFGVSIGLTIGSYAYFTTNVTGTAKLVTASWNFEVNNEPSSFTSDLLDLHPGIDSSIQLKLSAVNSELPVTYSIYFNNAFNIPNNLKFYVDAAKLREINPNGDTLSGVINAGAETIITIYYEWPYGSTAEEYLPGTAGFSISIKGIQADPS